MTERIRLVRRPAQLAPQLRDDPAQRAVIEHTDGPLLVLGGPGTGKTTVLVEAVAARVAEGTDPQRILVLTFGRRGAGRLRERIEARLAEAAEPHLAAERHGSGLRTIAGPLVRTFHGYAFGLLRRAFAERGDPPPRLLTGPEQDVIIRELLADAHHDPVGWPDALRPALPTRAFAAQLRDLLLRAAERGIDAPTLAEYGERYGRPEWVAAARFLDQYTQVLALREVTSRGSVAYDSAELIRAASALLADDPELLAAERARLAYVYVDELADTDPAQMDLLSLVAGGGTPLVAFADPDSSTYAFRGADPRGVASFPYRFRTASGALAATITLTRCFRADAALVAGLARLARRLRGPARHRAMSVEPDAGPGVVEVRTFRSSATEGAFVAHRLREAHVLHGVPWSRMAVIIRSASRQLAGIQRALAQAEVPTVTHVEDLPLHAQPAVAPLLLLLRCALEPDRLDEDAAVALLHSPLGGADPLSERRLRQGLRALALAAGDNRPSGLLLVEALREPAELAAIERTWAAPAQAVARLMMVAREAAARPGATAEDVLWAVWQASGLAERWAAASLSGVGATSEARAHRAAAADRDLDAVVALFDAAAKFSDRLPGARTEVFLDHVLGLEIPADSLAPTADRGEAVRILTAHAAKGLEWDVVAIVGVQEGVWPDLRLRGSLLGSEALVDVVAGRGEGPLAASQTAALLDEERRLFYVAASRARHRLLVTAVASGSTGSGDGEEQPSRFLDELAPSVVSAQVSAENSVSVESPPPDVPAQSPPPDRVPAGQAPPAVDMPTAQAPPAAGMPSTNGVASFDPGGGSNAGGGDSDGDGLRLTIRLPRALTLPALVAELRTVVTDPAADPGLRQVAAAHLAKLAEAGVRGAHPDEWWGLCSLSDDRPLREPGELVTVTPSTVDGVLRCGLQWLLRRHGGDAPTSAQQGIGNLVHSAAVLASEPVDRETLAARLTDYVSQRFDAIELAARWLAERERSRAQLMIEKLVTWLRGNPRTLAAVEREFRVQLADDLALHGRVDRLEVDEQGRAVVVDLKTGATKPTALELAEHAQLGVYQVAVAEGAFPDVSTEPGGAALVQLGTSAKSAIEQVQPPPNETPNPDWARALVRRAADTMAGATFDAIANASCRVCPVRTACPISGKGRQL